MKKILLMFMLIFSATFIISCTNNGVYIEPTGDNVGSFASYEQLEDYLKKFYDSNNNKRYYTIGDAVLESSSDLDTPQAGVDFGDGERDFSKTNNQVEGVEESDSIMTDGYYIYITSGNKFFMFDAETLEIIFTYELEDIYFDSLYIYEDKIVLLGSYYHYTILEVPEDEKDDTNPDSDNDYFYPYYDYSYGTKIIVLDKSDVEDVKVSRELDFESSYIASTRMIDGYLYLIMNNYAISYYYQEDDFVPKYMDSVNSDELVQLPANRIFFMPNDSENFSYLLLVSFDVTDDKEASVKAYLGSTYQIYMSVENLYITVFKYHYDEETNRYMQQTFIMRFAIENNQLSYKAVGEIKGMPLNQFSMDEYDGVFRIAVTDYDYNGEETIITNTIFLLDATTDDEMLEISKLSGLGKPGERIYAVRYSQDLAYVVTFVNTDPLYKLDLSDPENPVILGELYEEGVSDYLHEITENLMVGIGRQAETNDGWTNFIGVKVALYDTSGDEPLNLETYLVEGQYSYTQVTYNHKAFVYFAPQGEDFTYIAIPVSIYYGNYYRYSQKMFVFKIHHSGDLELVSELKHFDQQDNYFDSIEKAVMINNYIYTLSYSQIQVFDMEDGFSFVDKVVFNEMYYYNYPNEEDPISTDAVRE